MQALHRVIMFTIRHSLRAIIAFAAAAAVLEIATRALRPVPPLADLNAVGWDATSSPYRTAATVDQNFRNNVTEEINQLSLRGRHFPNSTHNTIRILLVGDSQVEAAALPFGDIPEWELERLLGKEFRGAYEVRSIGSSGWGQTDQLLALRRYYANFKADYMFVWHTPQNDFWENAFLDRSTTDRLGTLKPTFVLTPHGLKEFSFEPYRGNSTSLLNASHGYRLLHRIGERFGLIEESMLARDFNRLIPPPVGHQSVAREKCPSEIVDQWTYSRDRPKYQFVPVSIRTQEAVVLSRSHFSPFLKRMSERDKYLVQITQHLLRMIRQLAESNGTRFLVFFNSQTYRDGAHGWVPGSCVIHSGSSYELADVSERIRALLAEFDVLELNTAHHDISVDDVTVGPNDRHLNKLGNVLVFRELVRVLRRRGMFPPRNNG